MRYASIWTVLLPVNINSPHLAELATHAKAVPAAGRFFAQDHAASAKNQEEPQAKRCAYIVISEAPGIDPEMIKNIPPKFADNIPTLHVPSPCHQDSRATK